MFLLLDWWLRDIWLAAKRAFFAVLCIGILMVLAIVGMHLVMMYDRGIAGALMFAGIGLAGTKVLMLNLEDKP